MLAESRVKRVGLLATQGIRGGANRRVLQRIKDTGDIFMAYSDRPWVLEGAAVRVSIVGFDDGSEHYRTLNGKPFFCRKRGPHFAPLSDYTQAALWA